MIDLAVELLRGRSPEGLGHWHRGSARESPGRYGEALETVETFLGLEAVAGLVQEGVLCAYTPTEEECVRLRRHRRRFEALDSLTLRRFEADVRGWAQPAGSRALARIVAQYPHRFRNPIITVNFDPLLNIACRSNGLPIESLALPHDGSVLGLSSSAAPTTAIHLHGYWHSGGVTLHTPFELLAPRPRLRASLQAIFRESVVVILGCGGWADAFTGALVDVLNGGEYAETILTVHGSAAEHPLMRSLDADPRITAYEEVNLHEVLPRLAMELERDPLQRFVANMDASATGRTGLRRCMRPLIADGLASQVGAAERVEVVFWPVRLREPNFVHAAQAQIAGLLAREAGAAVLLLVDDLGRDEPELRATLIATLDGWVKDAAGRSETETRVWSHHLTDDVIDGAHHPRERPLWSLVVRMATTSEMRIAELLRRAKVVAPGEEDRLDGLVLEGRQLSRLFAPFALWAYLASLGGHGVDLRSVCTLSGADERAMWESWREEAGTGTSHVFITPLPDDAPRDPVYVMDRPRYSDFSAAAVSGLLRHMRTQDLSGSSALAHWVCTNLVELPCRVRGTEWPARELVESHGIESTQALALRAAVDDSIADVVAEAVAATFDTGRREPDQRPGACVPADRDSRDSGPENSGGGLVRRMAG